MICLPVKRVEYIAGPLYACSGIGYSITGNLSGCPASQRSTGRGDTGAIPNGIAIVSKVASDTSPTATIRHATGRCRKISSRYVQPCAASKLSANSTKKPARAQPRRKLNGGMPLNANTTNGILESGARFAAPCKGDG